ncbi:MAG: hypothetical protein JKY27_00860, partial [Magnetovibrio sp.]|nr:hypothetical protein [Magnetovibrio sp.]
SGKLIRKLVRHTPDAFYPDLAMCLGTRSKILAAAKQTNEALEAVTEALHIIQPLFLDLHSAFAQLTANIARDYMGLCKELEREPDMELLRPIIAVLQELKEAGGEASL